MAISKKTADHRKDYKLSIAPVINQGRLEHTAHPDDTVFQALSQVKSTHEAVFVLDNNDQFLGLVSPYKVLYQHKLLNQTKVSSVLIHPPTLTSRSLLTETAGFMVSLRIYTLPVFGDNLRLNGYVRGGDLLRLTLQNPTLTQKLSEQVDWREPITAPITTSVQKIFGLLRSKNITRVLLVDKDRHLKGVVARSDLRFALMTPSDRERLKSPAGANLYFNDNHAKGLKDPVSTLAVANVLTVDEKESVIAALKKMLSKQIHSVVQIDQSRRPIGFLSRSDFLMGLMALKPKASFPVILSVKTPNLQEYYSLVSQWYAEDFIDKHYRRFAPMQFKLLIKSSQNEVGKPFLFSSNLAYTLKNGKTFYAKSQHHWFKQVLIDGFNKLDKQLRRSN